MPILLDNKNTVGEKFLGKKMFNKDYVLSHSQRIATTYFPKDNDFLFFKDIEEARSLAKRLCINALERGISITKLEQFAQRAHSAKSFNLRINKHFGAVLEEPRRSCAYINIYEKERAVLKEVFGFSDAEIKRLAWGEFSSEQIDQLYNKIENYTLGVDQKTREIIIKFLAIRWGLDDGFPKPIRLVGILMGISDPNNEKIKKAMEIVCEIMLEKAGEKA